MNYTFRMHDPRVGRFFAVDPLTKEYPHYSPYSFSGNKVINHKEREGLEEEAVAVALGPPGWVYVAGKWIVIGALAYLTVETADKVIDKYKNVPELESEPVTTLPKVEINPKPISIPKKEVAPKPNTKPDPKPTNPVVYSLAKEEKEEPEFIYRGGSFTDSNFTPRPGKDDGIGLKSGLSTFQTPLQATQYKDGKAQELSVDALKKLGFSLKKTSDGHVGIRPPSQEKLKEWAASRPGLENGDDAHILTEMVKSARTREVKVKGLYDEN